MKCEELLAALNDYVDGAALNEVCAEFAQQLDGCSPCQVVVDNVQQTISLYRAGEPFAMPTGFQERLHESLRAKWVEKFGAELDSDTSKGDQSQ